MNNPLLTIQNLSKYYTPGQSVVMALNNINLTFRRGEFVAVTGESGSGKSTLSKVISGILPYESGEMLLEGRPTSHYDAADWELHRCRNVSYISQSYDILGGCTVLENVLAALRLTGIDPKDAADRAEKALRQVELWDLRDRRAAKLSSGQKQRLSIARALAKPAKILIADEPTGNLDGENSQKIVQLLADAARERLVIMVTHEFEEVSQLATRRIVLRDGVIIADQELRPDRDDVPAPDSSHPAGKKGLGLYTAMLQLKSHPMWAVLMTAFFALTVFAVFAFAGTFIMSLDTTPTYDYDNSAFWNGDDRRIVVCRADGADLTEADMQALLGVSYVEYLERCSYLADIQYAWRADVDYAATYSIQQSGGIDGQRQQVESIDMIGDLPFAQSIPAYADGREFLTAGRLPDTVWEVVATGDESLLGQTFTVYFQDPKNWAHQYNLCMDMTIVGITDQGSGLFFHDDVGRIFLANARLAADGYNMYLYVPSPTLSGMDTLAEATKYQSWINRYGSNLSFSSIDLDTMKPYSDGRLQLIGAHQSAFPAILEVSYEMFDVLTYESTGDQYTLMIQDYAYTDEVLEELHTMGYAAISPYREGSVIPNSTLANQRIQTLQLCLGALLIVVILLVVVLRAMFGLQTGDIRMLRNIGLDGRTAARSIWWQILIFAVAGQFLGWSVIAITNAAGIEAVAKLLRYLPLSNRVILSVMHLVIGALGALWVVLHQKKQIFPNYGTTPDLEWTDEEVGA